jgi:hypothetical protein
VVYSRCNNDTTMVGFKLAIYLVVTLVKQLICRFVVLSFSSLDMDVTI